MQVKTEISKTLPGPALKNLLERRTVSLFRSLWVETARTVWKQQEESSFPLGVPSMTAGELSFGVHTDFKLFP